MILVSSDFVYLVAAENCCRVERRCVSLDS